MLEEEGGEVGPTRPGRRGEGGGVVWARQPSIRRGRLTTGRPELSGHGRGADGDGADEAGRGGARRGGTAAERRGLAGRPQSRRRGGARGFDRKGVGMCRGGVCCAVENKIRREMGATAGELITLFASGNKVAGVSLWSTATVGEPGILFASCRCRTADERNILLVGGSF